MHLKQKYGQKNDFEINAKQSCNYRPEMLTEPYLNLLKVRLSLLVKSIQGLLQDPPGNSLCTACLPNKHGGVSRVFGLIKLYSLGYCKRVDLETTLPKLLLNSILQLQLKNMRHHSGFGGARSVLEILFLIRI